MDSQKIKVGIFAARELLDMINKYFILKLNQNIVSFKSYF